MKILFLLNGHLKGLSGGDQHGIQLANYLSSKNLSVSVCMPKGTYEDNLDKKITTITYLKLPFEDCLYNISALLFIIYLYRVICTLFLLHKQKFDISISTSHFFYDSIIPLFLTFKKNVVYIYHITSDQRRTGNLEKLKGMLEKITFKLIKLTKPIIFVDNSQVKKSLIENYSFNKNDIHLTKNGIDINAEKKVSSQKKIFDLSYCGRICKNKGIFDLVDMIEKIKNTNNPNIKAVIIGDGPEKNNILKKIKSKHLQKNIKITGYVSNIDKFKYLKASKIFAFPSHEEGWGIAIGEALSCNLPVIAFRLEEIIPIWKNNIAYIECFNEDLFVKKIENYLNYPPTLSKKLTTFLNSLGWDNILKKEMHLINTQ